jgi:hypothetical protein
MDSFIREKFRPIDKCLISFCLSAGAYFTFRLSVVEAIRLPFPAVVCPYRIAQASTVA